MRIRRAELGCALKQVARGGGGGEVDSETMVRAANGVLRTAHVGKGSRGGAAAEATLQPIIGAHDGATTTAVNVEEEEDDGKILTTRSQPYVGCYKRFSGARCRYKQRHAGQ